jgi:SAM-dependent methyltransferase
MPKNADHCEKFLRAETSTVPMCANYAPGGFPRFLHADVTQGIAEHFASQVPAILQRANKPQQAFRYAIQISAHPRAIASLPLPDHSVDFITSSMVASQFDFEPFSYFVRNLFLRFGQQAVEQNLDALNAHVETLRDNLFLSQVEGHCQEMLRLLKPGGRIYFSIEALHADRPTDPYFQPEVSCKAMGIIGRNFYFDLQTLPEIVVLARAAMVRGGESIIQSCLLLSKHDDPRVQKS